MTDTIFAEATAPGRAGVSVIRVSGPKAHDVGSAFCGSLPEVRRASLRDLRSPEDGTLLDSALVLVFDQQESFTGEKTVEFHIHGSIGVKNLLFDALAMLPDVRLADPGEFTRRALENGRLDLAQVEGLADLIDAETAQQHRQAVDLLSGSLSNTAARWRTGLVRSLALLEASMDFADEEIPDEALDEAVALTNEVLVGIQAEIQGSRFAERVREGFEVAIVGPPNAGKSSLLNRLAGRDAAITSEIAGTTRDVIEVRLDLEGYAVTLIDTAGLRETEDAIEKAGVDRALARAQGADLRVFLIEQNGDLEGLPIQRDVGDIVVSGKSDLIPGNDLSPFTGHGISQLIDKIASQLQLAVPPGATANRVRHRRNLEHAADALSKALEILRQGGGDVDLAAEEYRRALRSLDSLVGRVDVDDILDVIFASFCLGK